MSKIPEEKEYSRKSLKRKLIFFRLLGLLVMRKNPRGMAGKEQFLDTIAGKVRVISYNMQRPETLPLFVNIHGGGFIFGNADMDDRYMKNVADKVNAKILSIDYSLSPEAEFPTALNECYGVVKYAKEHAKELGIDSNKIAVGGHSAGGNLSAAICLKDETKELDIKCLILDYPPMDIYTDPYLKPQPKGSLPAGQCRIYNAAYCNNKEDRKNPLVSPAFATVDQVKSFPPTLIISASQDSLCKEDEDFRDKLLQAGVTVTHKRFEGSRHGFTLSSKPDAVEAWQMMIDFLKLNLEQK